MVKLSKKFVLLKMTGKYCPPTFPRPGDEGAKRTGTGVQARARSRFGVSGGNPVPRPSSMCLSKLILRIGKYWHMWE